jgi:hypothetical protein
MEAKSVAATGAQFEGDFVNIQTAGRNCDHARNRNMPTDIEMKLRALERLKEARLKADNAQGGFEKEVALTSYDQAINDFLQLVYEEGARSKIATRLPAQGKLREP